MKKQAISLILCAAVLMSCFVLPVSAMTPDMIQPVETVQETLPQNSEPAAAGSVPVICRSAIPFCLLRDGDWFPFGL